LTNSVKCAYQDLKKLDKVLDKSFKVC